MNPPPVPPPPRPPRPPGYVVYVFTRLQDGAEEGARCFERLEDALAYINAPKWGGDANTYHLFELGREIPLDRRTVEEPQPAKTATVYAVANPERAEGGAA